MIWQRPYGTLWLSGALALLASCSSKEQGSDKEPAAMAGMTSKGPDNGVRFSAQEIRQFGITFAVADKVALQDLIRATGTIAWDETRVSQITSRVAGYIETISADYTGQKINRGDTLFTLYSPELNMAGEELLSASKLASRGSGIDLPGIDLPRSDLVEASRRRLEQWNVPPSVIANILSTGRVPRAIPFVATSDGVIVDKNVQLGQAISTGQRLYTLAKTDVVWVEVSFRELDSDRVKLGAQVSVRLTGEAGPSLIGRISFIHPQLESATRTVRARIELKNPNGRLLPGRYVSVLMIHGSEAPLSVPSSAVVQTGEGSLVFRSSAGGLQPIPVKIGREVGGRIVILKGLLTGDSVVTSAQYLIEAESNLATAMKAMMGQMGAGANSMPGMTSQADGGQMDGMAMPDGGQ